ncbi:MAG: hypothetical protein ABIP89_11675 [Polyangiaceae bacterium]
MKTLKALPLVSLLSAATLFACSSPTGGGGPSEPWTQNGPPAGGPAANPPAPGTPGAMPGSDGGAVVPPGAAHISSDETWATGKQITASVVIDSGATVTIAPGAVITCSAGVTISVKGTLTASSVAAHAKLTGTGWTGILVVSGGTLTIDGVDIVGATTAIESEGTATFDHGALTGATTPFLVDIGGKISTTHSSVSSIQGNSTIKGAFVASYLDYDKSANEGILAQDPSATISIDDSTLHGSNGGDFVVSQASTSIHVGHTTISGAHCGFHFDSIGKFDITYVTDNTNSWGAMLNGSDNGPNSITYSNFANGSKDIDLQGSNGPLTMDHVYTGGKNSYVGSSPTITHVETMPVATAHPR